MYFARVVRDYRINPAKSKTSQNRKILFFLSILKILILTAFWAKIAQNANL
ncbi:MAG: hypothetical protein MUD08_03680 [Cytophagales bacterium]|nr:hypothetical protein [Cytophagales bacterium]